MPERGSVFSGAVHFFWRRTVKPVRCTAGIWLVVGFGRGRSRPPGLHILAPVPSSFLQNSVSECQVSLKYLGKGMFFRSLSTDNLRRIVGGGPEVSGRVSSGLGKP